MPMQMKRPAAAASKPAGEPKPKAKRQEDDPIVSKCNAIISLLRTAEGYPPATLQMLEVAAKGSLMVTKDSRHAVQNGAIEMVSEVLNSVEKNHADNLAALLSKIAEAHVEKAKREASAEAAKASLDEATAATAAAREALAAAAREQQEAGQRLDAATAEQTSGDASLDKAEGRKAAAEAAVKDHLEALKGGAAADVATSVKTVVQVGKDLGVEAQLLISAELVLAKAPAERGGFDGMVTQQVDEQFGAAIAKLADQLANGEAGKTERAQKVEACKAQVQAAAASQEQCQQKLEAAGVAEKEAEAAAQAAAKAVEDFGPEMEEAASNSEAAEAVLVACRADLATFKELVEGPQAPAAEEPAAEEPAGEEAASAEAADKA